jgi:hypothetical protein
MSITTPPYCPNPNCCHHRAVDGSWRWIRSGFFTRLASPHRIQRFQCCTCRRHFSTQTFSTTYWLRRPELLIPLFHRLIACSGYRQIAREHHCSPQTVLGQAARLGRHCLLYHLGHCPGGVIPEPLALDSFQSFELSQYHPTLYHLAAGRTSHFCYGFTDSELRRSGRMTAKQKRRRAWLEQHFGKPHPRAIEVEVAALLQLIAPRPQSLELSTDEHEDYPRALKRVAHLAITHRTISSRAARTSRNPLFEVNLLDLLIRHSGANHKRETIAFSKRRQSAIERLWVFVVWRNWIKSFSERARDATPAMRLGLADRARTVIEVLKLRLVPTRVTLPQRWGLYYWRQVVTRRIPNGCVHRRVFAV